MRIPASFRTRNVCSRMKWTRFDFVSRVVSVRIFCHWRRMVVEHMLDGKLIPREHGSMPAPKSQLSSLDKAPSKVAAGYQSDVEQLRDRTCELACRKEALAESGGIMLALKVPCHGISPSMVFRILPHHKVI